MFLIEWIRAWFTYPMLLLGPLLLSWLALLGGCSSLGGMTAADIEKLDKLSNIARQYGPQGSASLRAGRPSIAAFIEGVILIPGFEVDLSASADSARNLSDGKTKGQPGAEGVVGSPPGTPGSTDEDAG